MNPRTHPGERYGPATITPHWLMLAMLVGVDACLELPELFPRGSGARQALATWHDMLGLATFALVFLRLAFRLAGRMPPIQPPSPRRQHRLASQVHLALYAFLVAMPLLGWLVLSTADEAARSSGCNCRPWLRRTARSATTLEEIHVPLALPATT